MAKLKILVNFEFLQWFYIWVERKKIEREGGEVVDNRKYRHKKNRQLVSFLHRSRREIGDAQDEAPILKQWESLGSSSR